MVDTKRAVKKLVEEFKAADGWTKSEEDVQASFTLTLLRILGWGPANWQVNTGTAVKTGKKPDIVLKDDAGFTVLVIESKAPKRELGVKTHVEQLYRYCGYEGKYWGILTNFVEWRIYATYPPCIYKEFAFHDLLRDTYLKKEYVDMLEPEGLEFLGFLERQNLCAKRGRFDEGNAYYPPQEKIRDEFFNKLRGWRKKLRAELYKKYGKKYGKDDVDLGTQKILDRLIFIEVCTDKEILGGDVLESVLTADGRFYRVLKSRFERMDELFDTELFADHWIDGVDIPDKVIEPIIRGIAEVDFAILPVHVIGEVYEDYLGELVREKGRGLSAKSPKATRKAKGIYYTPDYIVDYIVTNTVGELLKKAKTEDDIKKIRVLDPACGSGSFLIRALDEFAAAYERVLNKKGTAPLFGFDVKRSILEHNLYGVDIDARAVEITKLNLMIKALAGTKYQDLKGRKLLPNLSLNIRCGNSLVCGDETGEKEGQLVIFTADHKADAEKLISLREKFYGARDDEEKETLLEEITDAEYAINGKLNEVLYEYFDDPAVENPFNYTVAFPEVFFAGGFDAVIGNPPYHSVKFLPETLKEYYYSNYVTADGRFNIFSLFIERDLGLLKKRGLLGYIVPSSLMANEQYRGLRSLLLDEYTLYAICDFKGGVFNAANVETAIIIAIKDTLKGNTAVRIKHDVMGEFEDFKETAIPVSVFRDDENKRILISKGVNLLKYGSIALGEIAYIRNGINTGNIADEIITENGKIKNTKRVLDGKDIARYSPAHWRGIYVIYDKDYVENLRSKLRKRGIPWTARVIKKDNYFEIPKIIIQRIRNLSLKRRLVATFDECNYYTTINIGVIFPKVNKYNILYILGILNSRLMNFYYASNFHNIQIKNVFLDKLPIRPIEFDEAADVARHDKIVALVEDMLELHKRLAATKSDADEKRIQRAIKTTDDKIDKLVYELYGLTEEEIKIVEGSS